MTAVQSIFRTHAKGLVLVALATTLAIGWADAAVRADTITDDNVDAAVAAAKTSEDHQALAIYFTAKSQEALANVKVHKRMSLAFLGKQRASWEAHCDSLMRSYQEQAKDYAALAKEQAALAK